MWLLCNSQMWWAAWINLCPLAVMWRSCDCHKIFQFQVLAFHEDGCLRRLSPSMSEFKPSGVVKKAELYCVSGGSHVVAVCSHYNLQTDGENEKSAQDNIMVILQFQLVCMPVHSSATWQGICIHAWANQHSSKGYCSVLPLPVPLLTPHRSMCLMCHWHDDPLTVHQDDSATAVIVCVPILGDYTHYII